MHDKMDSAAPPSEGAPIDGFPVDPSQLSRRAFLKGAAAMGSAVVGAGVITACGSSSSITTPKPRRLTQTGGELSGAIMPPYRQPQPGGTLRIGASTGSASDTLDVAGPRSQVDYRRTEMLYGSLLERDQHNRTIPALAEEITPETSKGDVWTVRLRDGAEFHNGKTLTVDDILFSINYHLTAKFSVFASNLEAVGFDLKNGVKKLDARTVRFTLKRPYAIFTEYPISQGYWIVPEGYNPAHPVGIGAFKYESFTPGQQSVFSAFPNYYGGKPLLDKVVVTSLLDDNARVNALLSNQVDAIVDVPLGSVEQIKGDNNTHFMVTPAGQFIPFVMRMDVKPFTDVRVRQAFRLLIDRNVMLRQALGGYGNIANDLYCPVDPFYASNIPQRVHDPDQAKSLLKAAGHSNLSIELVAAPVGLGAMESCRVFQAQAAQVGVNVKLTQLDVGTFFGSDWGKRTFTIDQYGTPIDYFAMMAVTEATPTALYNETHNADPKLGSLFRQALVTVDDAKRKQIAYEMQSIEHDSGGYIIPFFVPRIEAVSAKTAGWQNWPNYRGLNGWHLQYVGFAD